MFIEFIGIINFTEHIISNSFFIKNFGLEAKNLGLDVRNLGLIAKNLGLI
jgi:hypothetical protein